MDKRLAPQSHAATVAAVAFAAAAGLVYAWFRVTATLPGSFVPIALPLWVAELALMLAALAPLVPALVLRCDGRVEAPREVPRVDVVVLVGQARPLELRLALRSCMELRGRDGLVVVGGYGRSDVEQACAAFGVRHVQADRLVGFGLEADRTAPYLLIVPASSWVSPDAGVALAPAFIEPGVGAATGRTVTHGVIDLLGSDGYGLDIDADELLATRLDAARSAPPGDGPLLVRKSAALAVGGIDWDLRSPVLGLHTRLHDAGWGTRALHPPVAYRMAPAHESRALSDRRRRLRAWREAWGAERETAGSALPDGTALGRGRLPWRRAPLRLARISAWSVLARVVVLFTPCLVALTGRTPVSLDRPVPTIASLVVWLVALEVARAATGGRLPGLLLRTRTGVRTLGIDLAVLGPDAGRDGERARRTQFGVLASLLGSVLAGTVVLTGGFGTLDLTERLVTGAALVLLAALIRDASMAYRQQRLLPRVDYEAGGEGAIVDVSPAGYSVAASLPVGSQRRSVIELPYPGGRVHSVEVTGTVRWCRDTATGHRSYIEIDTDPDTAQELLYFCAVTAPTIRWLGGTARVVRRDAAGAVSGGY